MDEMIQDVRDIEATPDLLDNENQKAGMSAFIQCGKGAGRTQEGSGS